MEEQTNNISQDSQDNILDEITERLDKHENIITIHEGKINNNTEQIEKHECKLDKHTDELTEIRISNSAQQQSITDLNKNIEKLNQTIEKIGDKFETYISGENKSKIEAWKIIVVSVLLPIVFFFLNFISNNFSNIVKAIIK